MKGFTAEELEEMRLADEEIEREFRLTNEDLARAREMDKAAVFDRKDAAAHNVATQKKAWYEANRDKVAARQKAYREANREKINEKSRRKYHENSKRNQAGP